MNWNEIFNYDAATGTLIWKDRPISQFKSAKGRNIWRGVCLGKQVGGKNADGYMMVALSVGGVSIRRYIHRIIWEMHNGPILDGMMIDHVDCDRSNNKIDNLRLANDTQNACNTTRRKKPNVAGYRGVTLCNDARRTFKKWRARVRVNGKEKTIGRYETPELAYAAYCEAAKEHYGEFARVA